MYMHVWICISAYVTRFAKTFTSKFSTLGILNYKIQPYNIVRVTVVAIKRSIPYCKVIKSDVCKWRVFANNKYMFTASPK